MFRRTAVAVTVLTLVLLASGARVDPGLTHRLEDVWNDNGKPPRSFERLLIIGITEDLQVRKQFENKFVSHLRGFGVDGVTSYSLVDDLTVVEDETEIVRIIHDRGIDGALSVRVVPLAGQDDSNWATEWRRAVEADGDLRELIDDSLPLAKTSSKYWGVETAVWETENWDRIWAARTNPYKKKQLGKGAGAFVQHVIGALQGARLLERPSRD